MWGQTKYVVNNNQNVRTQEYGKERKLWAEFHIHRIWIYGDNITFIYWGSAKAPKEIYLIHSNKREVKGENKKQKQKISTDGIKRTRG